MKFHETDLSGVYLIQLDKIEDERGYFSRSFDASTFKSHGLEHNFPQCNISFNRYSSTLRGMHYQEHPYGEAKLIRCIRGLIFDVAIDLRIHSPTYKQWISVELSPDNHRMIYLPKGIAHGFLTLQPNSEVFYMMSEVYHPESARGVRWNDPAFNIEWPVIDNLIISEKDQHYEDFNP